ncbi:MAG: trimethylamine methyltransferase family protein, partial [Anaerolineales bacterium]|nr:trimethylamine methyltransferase family protein [Anaerolineales bacterium]
MAEVHRYSIRILEDTGVEVESKEALAVFGKSDAVKVRNGVVYLKEELINHAINCAPSNIEVFNKSGDTAFQLGRKQQNETYFGIGATNTWFQDIGSKQVELFTREHMRQSTRLGDLLDNFSMVSTLGIPSDVSAQSSDLYAALDMYANTSKPLVLLISGDHQINKVLELISYLHGDISEKPFFIPYVNPITPLVLNRTTTDKMIASIHHQLPLMYSNYSMYGGTSPVTPGGSLALLNSELLAGLVFSQLVREGSEIILGSLPAAFNMNTMGSYYTPASYLLNLACAEMMDHYEIPHCGTSGSNNGRGADLLSSGHLWLNHLSSCMGKVGCAPFVGGNFDSLVFSPATAVLSNQIIGEAREFVRGFVLNDEAVNLQEIREVGHGGDYFTSEQTLDSLHELSNTDELWSPMSLEAWKEKGMPSPEEELNEHARELLSRAQKASEDTMDLIQKGEEYIEK